MSIQDFIWLIKNKILTIFAVTLIATFAGVYMQYNKLPLYQTSTTIMITGKDDSSMLSNQPLTKTFAEIAKSSQVSEGVTKVILGSLTSEEVQSKISIQTIPDTSLIKIIVLDTDKFRAASIANNTALITKNTLMSLMKSDIVKIIDGADVPEAPFQSSNGINTLAGAFFGLIVAIAYVLLQGSFENRILSQEDIRKRLRLPVIGIIAKDKSLEMRKNQYFTPEQLLVMRSPKSIISQAIRILRHNIINLLKDQEFIKTLVVTSATEGEGKTIISANLAISMANLGREVILIDCNLNSGNQAALFKLSNNCGLENFLNNEVALGEVIQESHVEGLKIVTTGQFINTDEIFTSVKFKEFIKGISQKADLVIIDAPALSGSSDAVILCEMADKVLFISSKGTPLEKVQNALNSLKFTKASILGCVLNREA